MSELSDMAVISIDELNKIEGELFKFQYQYEEATKEIAKLNERLRKYENNDKAKQGSK
tara:strand:+ start:123 stop:296 length:174 start_codon:yes stop_codon:yes gene_type:complete